MCGIVGYIGHRRATEVILPALRRLEYRGYDSAGVASLNGAGLEVLRSVGKLECLEARLEGQAPTGTIGIGHTRWATHGRVSEENAHPHVAGRAAVIHNGIIENFIELRAELATRGRRLRSETDTEVISHLIDENLQAGKSLPAAVRAAARRLAGSFAIVVMDSEDTDRLVAVKTATPIVVGLGDGESFVASDVPAILDHTRECLFLEEGEVVELRRDGVMITDFEGKRRQRDARRISWDPVTARKGGYRHFLIKEIHEQPNAVADTLRGRFDARSGEVHLPELDPISSRLAAVDRIHLVGCGTAWHACLVGKFLLGELTDCFIDVDYGSEFRYRPLPLGTRDLVVAVSQSGETADTLGSLEEAKRRGATTLAICNVVDSSIARKAHAVLYTHAGPEISVCSTKAFTTQLTALVLIAIDLARRAGGATAGSLQGLESAARGLPELLRKGLLAEASVATVARRHAAARDVLFLGRGVQYPIALEGALKLKEISYVHAEGYPAGEMKHGPIALISEEVTAVILIPHDTSYPKTLASLKEVESRGGRIVAITDRASDDLRAVADDVIEVPESPRLLSPLPFTIPLQLFAYRVALERGTDIDQPRNLAKSVTVE